MAMLLTAVGLLAVSLASGQVQTTPKMARPAQDLSKLPYFSKEAYLCGQRGSEWLLRHNGPDGRFAPGLVPALRVPQEDDSFLRQAGATLALAKAAKFYGDEQAAAVARQAILTLLLDTAVDAKNPQVRSCSLPPNVVNPLGAAALLARAIYELPAPASDLLDQADQLCYYIVQTQQADGAFATAQVRTVSLTIDEQTSTLVYAGEALATLMRSHQTRPAPWKLEAVRRSLTHYQSPWRAQKQLAPASLITEALASLHAATDDKAIADFVFELNDWLCTFQYQKVDPLHPTWIGGFMSCADGKAVPTPPQVTTALSIASLVHASRVARKVGDVQRWERYKLAAEKALQFLTTLQFTEANTQHFADWYRPSLVGAFHTSPIDGGIRLDGTRLAVCTFVDYLTYLAAVQ